MTHRYRGRWTREWIERPPAARDTTTAVTWLQATRLYCDLRVPAGRPDFSGVTALADCSDAQLAWLSMQQGFAGHLDAVDDLCFWHRHIDLQPPSGVPDAGRMRWGAGSVFETGVFEDYAEAWSHTAGDAGILYAAKLLACPPAPARGVRQGVLVVAGDTFMFALERAVDPAELPALFAAAFARGERAARLRALDCEISLGTVAAGAVPWQVQRSTLPYLEGGALFDARELRRTALAPPPPCRASLQHTPCHWLIDEVSPAFRW